MNSIAVQKKVFCLLPPGYLKSLDSMIVLTDKEEADKRKSEEEEMTGEKLVVLDGVVSVSISMRNGTPFVSFPAPDNNANKVVPEANLERFVPIEIPKDAPFIRAKIDRPFPAQKLEQIQFDEIEEEAMPAEPNF